MTTPHRLELLAEHAELDRPSLFAIYGSFHNAEAGEVCGWGMEWDTDYGGALFYEPGTRNIWRSDSAESLLETYRIIADAHLRRLDPEEELDGGAAEGHLDR